MEGARERREETREMRERRETRRKMTFWFFMYFMFVCLFVFPNVARFTFSFYVLVFMWFRIFDVLHVFFMCVICFSLRSCFLLLSMSKTRKIKGR